MGTGTVGDPYIIAESGGDFSSIDDAMGSAADGDFFEITGTWTARENTRITVADSVTITATGSARHPGRPWRSGDNHYQHRSTSSGHSFTLTDSGTFDLDGVDIILDHTETSAEIFRANISVTSTITNCLLGFAVRTSEQDVYYTDNSEVDVTFEQCHFYNALRAVVDMTSSAFGTVNINSCTAYDIGFSDSQTSRSGLVGKNTSGTTTVNIYNTIVHMNEVGFPVCTNSTASNTTANIERLVTNSSQAPMDNAPATANYANNVVTATINDTDSSGNYILIDTSTSPYDLRLFDNATNNAAQDVHADATKANLTIPSTDILGTSRPQNTNFDIGAFEVVVSAGDTLLPNIVSETVTVYNPSLSAGLVTISPSLVSKTVTVFNPAVQAAVELILPNLVSATSSVPNVSLLAGTVTLSPNIVSETVTVFNPATSATFTVSPDLTTSTVTVEQVANSLLYTISANATSLAATVNQPAMPFEQFVNPNPVLETATVEQPKLLTGEVISPDVVSAAVSVATVSLQSGAVVILPLLTSHIANVIGPRLFDPATAVGGFFSNETMIEFFRQQTGLDSYQFNDLARAYYKQVASSDQEAFNDLEVAAQKAAGFVGLAPTDWRNL